MAVLRLVGAISLIFWSSVPPGNADNRQALVIGNSAYENVEKLANPRNDAADLAKALERIGFNVTEGYDLDFRALRLAIRDFSEKADAADIVLVYFAGHGIEVEDPNYLIPVNAELKRDRDVEFEAVRLDALLGAIERSNGLKIVLVDACRNNPFATQMSRQVASRSIRRGLARIEPSGVLVGYAAKGGTVALDGKGRNSPYAAALLRHLEEPGLELGKLFRKVRDTVFAATAGAQEPFVYGSLPGRDIFLVPPVQKPEVSSVPQATETDLNERIIKEYTAAAERDTVWRWSQFLLNFEAYPEHRLVQVATRRRNELQLELDIQRGYRVGEPWLETSISSDGREVVLSQNDRRLVQKSLNIMGFETGGIDGQFGPRTRQAISQARLKASLSPGSEVDVQLLRILPNVHAIETLQSKTAKSHPVSELPAELEPRLLKALTAINGLPVIFDYFGGQLYIVVRSTSGDWSTARNMAKKAGGYVVAIGSAEENEFLVDLFSQDPLFTRTDDDGAVYGPMIGMIQADRSREPAGGWVWSNGEPVVYRAWNRGNPDNYMGRQHHARFYRPARYRGTNLKPRFWDDTSNSLWAGGYIIEVD